MKLPLDYTFCVPSECEVKRECARYEYPDTEKPLSMADFSTDLHKDWSGCCKFIKRS